MDVKCGREKCRVAADLLSVKKFHLGMKVYMCVCVWYIYIHHSSTLFL